VSVGVVVGETLLVGAGVVDRLEVVVAEVVGMEFTPV
jgi:hypothetical protein